MKLFKKLAFYAITITMISYVSCQKESTFEVLDEVAEAPIKVIYYNNGKGTEANMLAFKDKETARKLFFQLKDEIKALNKAFVEEWRHLDEKAINIKEDQMGFDANKPLYDFEKEYGFNSMRGVYQEKMNKWLQNKVLDDKTSPDNDYPFDEVEMTLFDENGVIKIGNSIFVMEKDVTHEIKDGDLTKISRILNGESEIDNVIVLGENEKAPTNVPCDPCHSDAYDYDWSIHEKDVDGISYRIKAKWKINNNHPLLLPYFHVETKSYKWRKPWWGGSYAWYKHRTWIEAGFEGDFQMYGNGSIYRNICCIDHIDHAVYSEESDSGYERSINYFLFSGAEYMKLGYFDETFKTIHKQKFTVTRWVGSEE